ncbi:MAG: S8 family peptidase, partial [Clostridiales bacterium]|nr:S8 family peptidase [Clostridiales bacterium]
MENAKRKVNYKNPEGLSGRNITAAVLDTGISDIYDFKGRIKAFKDIIGEETKPYDDNSHGSHVSGILGGRKGIAPNVSLVGVKVLDKLGRGSSADLLAGLQWVYENRDKYKIRIANLSVGTGISESFDPLVSAVEALWEVGVVVVNAAGNGGPAPGSVTSPGTSRKAITVGCFDDNKKCSIWDTEAKDFSGRGPTRECIIKPDILAPGAEIYSCSNTGEYIALSGTSMSTPIVSGAVALLLEKYPGLTPNQVKYMLKITSDDLNFPKNRQGWGLLNIEKLLTTEPVYI